MVTFLLLSVLAGAGVYVWLTWDKKLTARRVEALEKKHEAETDRRNQLIEHYVRDRESKEQEIVKNIGASRIVAALAVDPASFDSGGDMEEPYEVYFEKIFIDAQLGLIKVKSTNHFFFNPDRSSQQDIAGSGYEVERRVPLTDIKDVAYKEQHIRLSHGKSRSVSAIKGSMSTVSMSIDGARFGSGRIDAVVETEGEQSELDAELVTRADMSIFIKDSFDPLNVSIEVIDMDDQEELKHLSKMPEEYIARKEIDEKPVRELRQFAENLARFIRQG